MRISFTICRLAAQASRWLPVSLSRKNATPIRNPFLTEREQEREKISHCYQCLKKCDKASIPYCITTALTRAADGDTDNALLFCGENAWRLDHMTTVPELMAELAGESLPDSKK